MPVKKVQQSVPTGAVAPSPVRPPPLWVPPRPAPPVPAEDLVEYPSEDGIPMAQSDIHALRMIVCYRILLHWFLGRMDLYVGIDLLVYYVRGDNTESVAPDVFVSFGVPQRSRPSYKVWEEGKPPDVVWEFGSESTAEEDAGPKKEKYRRMGVREYWLVDPDGECHERRLHGFALVNGQYVELPWEERPDGTLAVWSPVLQLEQHCAEGELRFWNRKTEKYLELPEEQAESRADREAQARKQAEEGRKQAEEGRKQAEEGRKQAESRADHEAQAREEADQARREAESRAECEAQARKEAESRAESEAQARQEELRKRKAVEARLAELEAKARGPRNSA